MKLNRFCIGLESDSNDNYSSKLNYNAFKISNECHNEVSNVTALIGAYRDLTKLRKNCSDKKYNKNNVEYNRIISRLGIKQNSVSLESYSDDREAMEGLMDSISGTIKKVITGLSNVAYKFTSRYKEISAELEEYNDNYRERLAEILRYKKILDKDVEGEITDEALIKNLGLTDKINTVDGAMQACCNAEASYGKYLKNLDKNINKINVLKTNNIDLLKVVGEAIYGVTKDVFTNKQYPGIVSRNEKGFTNHYYPETVGGNVISVVLPNTVSEFVNDIDNKNNDKFVKKEPLNKKYTGSLPYATMHDLTVITDILKSHEKYWDIIGESFGSISCIVNEDCEELIERMEDNLKDISFEYNNPTVYFTATAFYEAYLYMVLDGYFTISNISDGVFDAALSYLELSIKAKR